MADTTISQLNLVTPIGEASIPLSQNSNTSRTLASSLTANCLPVGSLYSVQYLIVGGGGGGGQDYGGGGGAGGFLEGNTQIAVGQTYPVIVGLGGTREYQYIVNKNGGNSSFNNVIAYGGGKGGGHNANIYTQDTLGGTDGGSGGGPYRGYQNISAAKGRGIFGQGNDSAPGSADYGGAGGGAGGPGGIDNNGGPGKYSTITGTNTYYASGGTIKNSNVALLDKPSNTGYGGDANYGGWGVASGGGSGIVVIAYPGAPRGTAYLNSTTILVPDTTSRPGYTVHKFLQGGYFIA